MMRTCQHERLAAEATADRHQIAADKCPSAQTERIPPESASERDIRLQQMSTHQCERLAAETTPEKDARVYSEKRTTDS